MLGTFARAAPRSRSSAGRRARGSSSSTQASSRRPRSGRPRPLARAAARRTRRRAGDGARRRRRGDRARRTRSGGGSPPRAHGVVALGEMGIGEHDGRGGARLRPARLPAGGRLRPGTGLDDAGLARKVDGRRADARGQPARPARPARRARRRRRLRARACSPASRSARRAAAPSCSSTASSRPSAALVAARLAPALGGYLVASHRSPEPGHALVLAELGLEPLLDLELRLGEGSGAALALPLARRGAGDPRRDGDVRRGAASRTRADERRPPLGPRWRRSRS